MVMILTLSFFNVLAFTVFLTLAAKVGKIEVFKLVGSKLKDWKILKLENWVCFQMTFVVKNTI